MTSTTTPHPHELARAIAPHLPPGWQQVDTPHEHAARIIGPNGERIIVRVGTYGAELGRAVLAGGMPDGASYSAGDYSGAELGSITVGAHRDPAAIARDMIRRLLPDVMRGHHEVTGRIAQRVGHERARARLADELAAVLPHGQVITRPGDRIRADMTARLMARTGECYAYGHMAPDHDAETVSVELRGIPADRARELAELIATWQRA